MFFGIMHIICPMKKNGFLKKILVGAGIVLAVVVLYVGLVYAAVFVPSFTRHVPGDKETRKHFKEQAYYDTYQNEAAWFASQEVQEISIVSFDGLRLSAYNLPNERPAGTMVLVHGYHSEPIREYAALAHFYYDLGYNIIMPVQRTHGTKGGLASEGKYITFGVKERHDVRDWIAKANELYGADTPLFVQGISMGCATAVMTLGFELPPNVCGIIADCGFTTPREIIWKVLTEDMRIPTARLIIKIGNFFTNRLAGFDMAEYSTLDALRFNKTRAEQIPVIFIHGTADDFVPIEMSERNCAECLVSFYYNTDGSINLRNNEQQEKYSLVEIKDAAHAIENFVAPETYRAAVAGFLSKYNRAE